MPCAHLVMVPRKCTLSWKLSGNGQEAISDQDNALALDSPSINAKQTSQFYQLHYFFYQYMWNAHSTNPYVSCYYRKSYYVLDQVHRYKPVICHTDVAMLQLCCYRKIINTLIIQQLCCTNCSIPYAQYCYYGASKYCKIVRNID